MLVDLKVAEVNLAEADWSINGFKVSITNR